MGLTNITNSKGTELEIGMGMLSIFNCWRGATPADLILFVVVLLPLSCRGEKCNPKFLSRPSFLPTNFVQFTFLRLFMIYHENLRFIGDVVVEL